MLKNSKIQDYFGVIDPKERLEQSEKILFNSMNKNKNTDTILFIHRRGSRRIINKLKIKHKRSIQTRLTLYYKLLDKNDPLEKEEENNDIIKEDVINKIEPKNPEELSVEFNKVIEYMIEEGDMILDINIDEEELEILKRTLEEEDEKEKGRRDPDNN